MKTMSDIEEVLSALNAFNKKRDWEQFHNPKDLALALSIEASELLELFLWKKAVADSVPDVDVAALKDELADVFAYGLVLMQKYDFDFKDMMLSKINKNEIKYPVEQSKGKSEKYNKL